MVLTPPTRPRRLALVLAAVGLVVLLLVLVAVLGDRGTDPAAAPRPTATPSATSTPAVPTPGPSTPAPPTPDPAAVPDPDPGAAPEPAPEVSPPTLGSAAEVAEAMPSIEGDLGHLNPVEAGEIAQVTADVTVTLDAVERVNVQASGPGEVSGPAVALTVTVTNGSAGPLTLDGAVVNLYGQGGAPGSVFSSDPRQRPLTGELDPGARQSGTYVLSLPSTIDGEVVVSVSLGADLPTPVFIATALQES